MSSNGKPCGHHFCPLTGCPEYGFEDFESFLQHVYQCRYLPGATYWCDKCRREESFAVGALRYEKTTKDHKHGKESPLRDAVLSLSKHFGRKKDLKQDHNHELEAGAPLPKDRSELQATGFSVDMPAIDWSDPKVRYLASNIEFDLTPKPTYEICTMNPRGSYVPPWAELTTPRSEPLGPVSFTPRIEMSGTRSYIHRSDGTDSDNHNIPIGYASTSPRLSKNWSEKSPESPHSALVSPKPLDYHDSKSHSYHPPYLSNDSITDMEYHDSEQHGGKASATSHGLSPEQISLPSDLESGLLRGQSTYGGMTPRPRQDLGLDIPQMAPGTTEVLPLNAEAVPIPLAEILNRQEVCRSLPHGNDKHNSVDKLYQIGNDLEFRWARKLKASPKLSSITSHLHSAPALQGGLGVWKQLVESNTDVPRTMEHVFQFMHIAFACAFKSYYADSWYPWEAFYDDVLHWSRIIAEPEERELYLQIADVLWSVEGTLSTSQQRPIPFETAYDRRVVLESLNKGDVMKSCARYLDGT